MEPSGDRLAVVGFEDAKGFAVAKVEETAVTPDVRFVLEASPSWQTSPNANFPTGNVWLHIYFCMVDSFFRAYGP